MQSVPIATDVVSSNHAQIRVICTTLCDKVSVTCGRSVVSFTNKIDRHDIPEILLKVALNTIKPNQSICNHKDKSSLTTKKFIIV